MKLRRRLAGLVCDLLAVSLPASDRDWARAARAEVSTIDDDAEALAFALETLWGLGASGLRCRLLRLAVWIGGGERDIHALVSLGRLEKARLWPRALGVFGAIGAGAAGLAYLASAGAPSRYLAINGAALLVGLAALALAGRLLSAKRAWPDSVLPWLGLTLFGVAAFGEGLGGATRWLRLGSLAVQPSLVVLPTMIVGFARSRTTAGVLAMGLAAVALALQPDPAMAGALCAGLAAVLVFRPDRLGLIALMGGAAGFEFAVMRADALPSTPFVDGVLTSAFDLNPLLGLAVLGATGLLLLPGLLGGLRDREAQGAYGAFGAVWGSIFVAAAIGPYPTPVIGYGGSAIVGYLLSLAMLPPKVPWPSGAEIATLGDERAPTDPHPRLTVP
jgi:hypothetical protein